MDRDHLLCMSRAAHDLGYFPRYDLDQGLARTLEENRDHRLMTF